jgi:hypothetical protein
MNNIIKKTAIVTALSLFAITFVIMFSLFAFAPATAGNLCYELGLKKIALSCYEKEYNKTGEFDDLINLLDNAIFLGDNERVCSYGEITFSRTGELNYYCETVDADKNEQSYPTYDYYATAIANAYYKQNQVDNMAQFVLNNMTEDGYTETSALYYSVKLAGNNNELRDALGRAYESNNEWTFIGRSDFRKEIQLLGYEFN